MRCERKGHTCSVMDIQLHVQSEDASDAADVVSELLGFVAGEGAAEEGGLAVAEPLFEDLVAAEGVGPDGFGEVFPAGGGVEVDVEEALVSGGGGGFTVKISDCCLKFKA